MARKYVNEKMKIALEIEVFEPQLPLPVVAERVGIDIQTLYNWHCFQPYKDAKEKMLKERFEEFEALALQGLENCLLDSEWNAIKYVLDANGHNAPQKIELDTNTIKVSITDD